MKRDRKADEERQALQDHLDIAPDISEVAGKTVEPLAVALVEFILPTPLDKGLDRLRHDR